MDSQTQSGENRVLDFNRYLLKKQLREAGVEWHEDAEGKFRIWLRLAPEKSDKKTDSR